MRNALKIETGFTTGAKMTGLGNIDDWWGQEGSQHGAACRVFMPLSVTCGSLNNRYATEEAHGT